jgi:hypothetical protein
MLTLVLIRNHLASRIFFSVSAIKYENMQMGNALRENQLQDLNSVYRFCVSHTVYYKTVNWRKSNQQTHCNCKVLNQPSRDVHSTTQSNIKQQNVFNTLFTRTQNVNKLILENIHIVLPLYHITSTLMMARE